MILHREASGSKLNEKYRMSHDECLREEFEPLPAYFPSPFRHSSCDIWYSFVMLVSTFVVDAAPIFTNQYSDSNKSESHTLSLCWVTCLSTTSLGGLTRPHDSQ